MTLGFFSRRGQRYYFGSRIIIVVWLWLFSGTGFALETAATSEDNAKDVSSDANDDSFFESLGPLPADSEDESYESTVVGKRVLVTDDTSGFAQTIDVKDAALTLTSAADVLSKSVGVGVRKTGGLGSSAFVSIRGSTSRQVPVLLDGMEIGGGGSSAVDLSDFSLDVLDSIEVYRGSAPLVLGQSGMGGAVCLRTKKMTAAFTQVSASLGSFGAKRLMVGHGAPIGDIDGMAVLTTEHSDGDFYYLNRNGTLDDTAVADDRIERRLNNQHTAYGGLIKFSGPVRKWKWTLGDTLSAKQAGAPGIESVQTKEASLQRTRNLVFGKLEGPIVSGLAGSEAHVDFDTGYTYLSDTFFDPLLEFNNTSQTHSSTSNIVPAKALLRVDWKRAGTTVVLIDNLFEQMNRNEAVSGEIANLPEVKRNRTLIGAGQQVSPISMLSIDADFRLTVDHSISGEDSRTEPYWSPSVGVKLSPLSWLTVRTSFGRPVRLPDLDELYGAFGAIVGNPTLREETAINGDAGLTIVKEFADRISLRVDSAWFCSFAKDLIVYEQNSQNTVRPENVSKAVIQGVENGLNLGLLDMISLQANYTYLYAINRSDIPFYYGKRLPGKPAHRLYAKVEAGQESQGFGGHLWLDIDFMGRLFLKQSNQEEFEVPLRFLLGAGYRLSHGKSGLSLTFEIRNVLNQITAKTETGLEAPISDYVGFPLPGRELFVTLSWKG